jgi:homoserine acetyltransferase
MLGIDDPQSYGYSQKAKKSLGSSNMALITYLSDKMRVAKMNDDGVVCTMIGAWLAELYLHERERSTTSALGLATPKKNARASEASHQALLNQFLTNHVNSMDAKTIMRILASHDVSAAECSFFAAASGDVGTAVNAALCDDSDEMVRRKHWLCGCFTLFLLADPLVWMFRRGGHVTPFASSKMLPSRPRSHSTTNMHRR